MKFFDRLRNGWKIGMTSLTIIKENQSLLLFPILSSATLILVVLSFAGGFFALFGVDIDGWIPDGELGGVLMYVPLFIFYLIAYFIMVFFNVGLVHCARLIFEGKHPTVRDGINYSSSRVGTILSWSLLAATVGVILKVLEDRLGWLGQIAVSLIGVAWSFASFFVIPIIAYEDVTPFEAVKRSAEMMKAKWGETIGANFSFVLFFFLGYPAIIVLAILLSFIHPILGIGTGVLLAVLLHTVIASARTVFLAATYNNMVDRPAGSFEGTLLDSAFILKK